MGRKYNRNAGPSALFRSGRTLAKSPMMVSELDDCPDCAGRESCEGCLTCNGTGTVCKVCGEASDACFCEEGGRK